MINMCTSLEQSKKLLSIGLDPSTADMCYPHFIRHGVDTYSETPEIAEDIDYPYEMPCWSLTALLELMPFFITIKEEGEPDEYYHFQLNRNGSVFHSKWQASYHGLKTKRGKVHTRIVHWAVGPEGESDTPIDAAFEMVCWLKTNKII